MLSFVRISIKLGPLTLGVALTGRLRGKRIKIEIQAVILQQILILSTKAGGLRPIRHDMVILVGGTVQRVQDTHRG